jgi:hypothetical protein
MDIKESYPLIASISLSPFLTLWLRLCRAMPPEAQGRDESRPIQDNIYGRILIPPQNM